MGLALWLLSFCVLGESATAARQLGTTINVGEFRVVVDSWIPGGAARGFAPVRVTAINDGLRTERLDLTLMGSINYAMRLADQGRKLRLEPGESVSLEMLVNLDRNHGQGNYTIMAASEGERDFARPSLGSLQVGPDARVIGFLGASPLGENPLAARRSELPLGTAGTPVLGAHEWSYGVRMSSADTQVAQLFSMGFDDLPQKTMAWSGVDTVIVDVDRVLPSDPRWQRLLEWAHEGGQLAFVGDDLERRLRSIEGLAALTEERFRARQRQVTIPPELEANIRLYQVGFGCLALLDLGADAADYFRAPAVATGSPGVFAEGLFTKTLRAFDASRLDSTPWPSAISAAYAANVHGGASPWCEPFDEDGMPIRTVLVLLFIFTVLVGPWSVAYSRKRDRPGLLLVAVPLISLLATCVIVGYGLLRQGLGTEGYAHSLSIVDQVEKRATAALRRELIMGRGGQTLQPLPATTVLVPVKGYGEGEVRSIQEDGNQPVLSGDFLPVRTRTSHVILSTGTTRARLEWSAPEGDSMKVTNALGVELEALEVMAPDGRVFATAGRIAEGGSVELKEILQAARSASRVRSLLSKAASDPIFAAAKLRPGGYLAVSAAAGPGVDDASVKMDETLSVHGIVGQLSPDPAKWYPLPSGSPVK